MSLGGKIRLGRKIRPVKLKIHTFPTTQRRNIDFSMSEKYEQMKLQGGTIKMIKSLNEMINGQRLKDSIHLIW